jgi:hypothetical protein
MGVVGSDDNSGPIGPGAETSDDEQLRAYGAALADGVVAALPGWVERSVERLVVAYRGALDDDTRAAASAAGEQAALEVGPPLRRLLEQDVDDQRVNPLAIVRSAVRYPTEVLRVAGVPPVVRDDFAEDRFPDDVYDLTPAAFADLDPALHELGLRWGGAKAFVHKRRHGS